MDDDVWGDHSFLSTRDTYLRTGRPHKYDAVSKAIRKNYPATGPGPDVEEIADAIVDAVYSPGVRFGQKVAAMHAIFACACVRFKNIHAVRACAKTKAIERVHALSNAEYPREVHERIQQLKALQEDHDKFEKEMLDDILSIESRFQDQDDESQLEEKQSEINAAKAKYHQSVEPLFAQRREIVAGDQMAVDDETLVEPRAEIGIPKFWYEAMLNSDTRMNEQIMLQDAKALEYLADIRCSAQGDPEGLKFEFFFKSNPYFKNEVLTKVIHNPSSNHGIGTSIDWYPGKCWTHMNVKKRKWGVCDKCDPLETQTIKNVSFFNFFTVPTDPSDEARDSYISDLLEKKIIPHAVDLFLDRGHYLATIDKLQGLGADA